MRNDSYFTFNSLPTQLQVNIEEDDDIEFELEENTTTGYTWFARYDPRYVDVDIDHKRPKRYFWPIYTGLPGRAEIEIEGRHPGDTMVELIYARRWEWEKGIAPANVIQLFVHIRPDR